MEGERLTFNRKAGVDEYLPLHRLNNGQDGSVEIFLKDYNGSPSKQENNRLYNRTRP